ncbi:DUF3784 domain-containing protein [Hydrogenoanaerobacterium sp.]|uniref:DUF3784 domain-containing protein n=1 Tax=Hydrogenoanaerobacterium sp. TaxID=2953763 RepID=UPI0028A16B3C|nr:DUF3784 domain-containing protein [Hydrogenoanaerobacterium sp.]
MDNTWDLLLALAFLALGVAFRMGKCTDWVLGKDEAVRAKYNEETSMRFFSILMFVLSACNWISVLGSSLNNTIVVMVGIGLNLIVLVVGMTYFLKSKKFRK